MSGNYCPACDPIPPDIVLNKKFCFRCGKKMIPAPPKPKCNWCGEEMISVERFCQGCGRDRQTALYTSPPPKIPRPPTPKKRNWFSVLREYLAN